MLKLGEITACLVSDNIVAKIAKVMIFWKWLETADELGRNIGNFTQSE